MIIFIIFVFIATIISLIYKFFKIEYFYRLQWRYWSKDQIKTALDNYHKHIEGSKSDNKRMKRLVSKLKEKPND